MIFKRSKPLPGCAVALFGLWLAVGILLPARYSALPLAAAAEKAAEDGAREPELHFPDEPPPEPEGYKLDDYRSLVPETLAGAVVLDDAGAREIYKQGDAVFIDVMPFTPKPPNLPEGMIWRDKKRDNIEGSHWLANVGYGRLPKEMDEYFRDHLKRLSGGALDKPLLFYCQADCWMSWNAAKRALEYGYRTVYWYPDGTDGWVKAGGTVVKAVPYPLPNMTRALVTKKPKE